MLPGDDWMVGWMEKTDRLASWGVLESQSIISEMSFRAGVVRVTCLTS